MLKIILLYLVLLITVSVSPIACDSNSGTTKLNTPTIQNTLAITQAPSADVLAEQGFEKPQIPRLTAWQLNKMLENGDQLVVIDTRDDFFYGLGHIPESINIDWHPETLDTNRLLELPQDKQIIFYCD